MPGISTLVAAISTNVNAALTALGLSALTDGGIVIGRVELDELVDGPRVIFVPKGSKFGPRNLPTRSSAPKGPNNPGAALANVQMSSVGYGYTSTTVSLSGGGGTGAAATAVLKNGGVAAIALTNGGSGYTSAPTVTITDATGTGAAATAKLGWSTEKMAQLVQRSLFTDTTIFEVHCWGIGAVPDWSTDFDTAQLLYQQVIASAWDVAPGIVRPTPGLWMDSKPGVEQMLARGRYFVFGLEVDTPLLDAPLQFAPVGVQPLATLTSDGEAP